MRTANRCSSPTVLASFALGLALLLLPAGCGQDSPTEEPGDTQAPTALADPSIVSPLGGGESETIILYGSDDLDDESDLYIRVVTAPQKGVVEPTEGNAPLEVVYTLMGSTTERDSFKFTATDSAGNTSLKGLVSINPLE